MKHLFIVNPVAGGKDKTETACAQVARYFSGREGRFEVYTTRAPLDACNKIRREAAENDALRVYACGGDGTLNECVSAAYGLENVAVTCFPTGTGNDFIKIFGAEGARFRDLGALIEGETRRLDLIRCNEYYCLNICSVGIDARVGADVHKYSHIPLIGGATGYVTSLAVNFFKSVSQELRIVCGGRLFYGDINLACACNGQYYGGGFHPVPEARPDDGVLDFLIVRGVTRAKIVSAVMTYAKGGYAKLPEYITHIRDTKMSIESPEEIVVNLDGESVYAQKIDIELIPGGIPFIVPTEMAFFAGESEKIRL